MAITRRTAIISSLLALGGTPIYSQQDKKDEATLVAMPGMTPIGISVSLDAITFLDVSRGRETVRIQAQEIWDALHVK